MTSLDSENGRKRRGVIEAQEPWLDRWVRERPVRSFSIFALVAAALFVFLYWMTGAYRVGGYQLDNKITEYVGAMATTVVALAGALVSVMLARLALKLGREAKEAAERGNDIQEQMRKFDDPRLVEARESQKLAEQLDRLAESLRKYSAVAFSSLPRDQPIGEILFAYQRCSELLSDSALYRYCSKLVGEAEAEKLFSSMEAKIFEAKRAMGYDKLPDRSDAITISRNAEKVAIEVSRLLPLLERGKQAALQADKDHGLHQLALDLEWEGAMNNLSCCERAANGYFRGATSHVAGIVIADLGDLSSQRSAETAVAVDALLREGARSVVHVLETDLPDLLHALGSPPNAAKVPEPVNVVRHDSLRDFVVADYEGRVGMRADVIVAGWDSTLRDEPGSVTYEKLYQPWDFVVSENIGLESADLWGKATFLAKNPAFERVFTAALRDLKFLREMSLTDVSDDLYHSQGIDPADVGGEVFDQECRTATRSANRLRYIHAAIEDLRKIHDRKGSVVVPDRNPYEALTVEDIDRAIIIIRPYFARIDMSLPGSGWEQKDQWFEDRLGGYSEYRWDGSGT
jgi:hypothetical protein